MGILEIIAEQRLGTAILKSHPRLSLAIKKSEKGTHRPKISAGEKARIMSILELCFDYTRESDTEEKAGILRTLEEISFNEALEMPTQSIEEWVIE